MCIESFVKVILMYYTDIYTDVAYIPRLLLV